MPFLDIQSLHYPFQFYIPLSDNYQRSNRGRCDYQISTEELSQLFWHPFSNNPNQSFVMLKQIKGLSKNFSIIPQKLRFLFLLTSILAVSAVSSNRNLESKGLQTNEMTALTADNADPGPSVKEAAQEQIPGVGLSIVFVFGGLLMGGLLKVFSRITQIPYNPLLILAGISIGFYYEHLGFIGKAAILMSDLNPNGVIAIFLPALIFESAFKTEWHMFKKQSGQTLILGIPCAIIGAFLVMVTFKLLVPETMDLYSWTQAFLVGSVLMCTDIFSFVQRLRNHGTPQKIVSLIEGESLINYCTCVLVFQIINEVVVDYNRSSVLYLIQLLVEETLGGLLFGLLFAVLAVVCLKRIIYDGVLVVTIMVIFCYSIYLLAEFSVLRVSGIVSIVVYALYMNVFGKTILTGEVLKYVNNFWAYVVFVAETSIFLIAGVNVGVNVLTFENLISEREFFLVALMYLACLASRFLSIFGLIRWLSRLGYGMNAKEVLVIAFTGLKGAIGISLAMLIYENEDYSEKVRHFTLFLVAGNSLLSLIINGSLAGFLVKLLGLSTLTKVEYKFFKEFLHTFEQNILQEKEQLREKKYLEMVNWEEIDVLVGIPLYKQKREQTEKIIARSAHGSDSSKFQKRQMYKLEETLKSYTKKNSPITTNMAETEINLQTLRFELIVELRKRFIKASINKYWEMHDESYIAPGALLLLLQSAYFDLDTETEELESWPWIKSQISYNIKFMSELMKISLLNQVAKSYLFQYISYCYEIVSCYIEASESVRAEFRSFGLVSHQKDVLEVIMVESEQNQKEAEAFLENYLQPSFPEIEREVITRKASYTVLSHFKKIINRFYLTGQLEASEYETLRNIAEQRSLELDLSSPKWETPEFINLLQDDSKVFGLLPITVLEVLSKDLSEEQTFDVNEKILENNEIAKYVYFVKKGSCYIEFINKNTIYKEKKLKGELIGFESIVSNVYKSTATANTMVTTIAIKKTCIEKVMDTFPVFEEAFWKRHIFELYKMFISQGDLTFHLSHLSQEVINELLEEFELHVFPPGAYGVVQDMIYLRGQIKARNIIKEENEEEQKSEEDDFIEEKPQGQSSPRKRSNRLEKAKGSMKEIKIMKNFLPQPASNSEAHPLMFLSADEGFEIEVIKTSTFLIGSIDYDMIEKANRFYSHYQANTSRAKRRDTLDSNKGKGSRGSNSPLEKFKKLNSSSRMN